MNVTFTALVEQLKCLFTNSKATLKNVVVILLVFGLEQIFEKGVFKCPTSNYRFYGFVFIVGPALCLFNLTLLLHNKFWDVITGCRHHHYRNQWVCRNVLRIAFQAILPPGVWVVMALIQSRYFVCAKLGPEEEALKKAINATAKEQIKNEYATAEAQSQILAWVLFDSIVVVGTLAVCVRRCCCLRAEGSLPNTYIYERIEAEAAVATFKEQMEEEAKKEGENYVRSKFAAFDSDVDGHEKVIEVRKEVAEKYPRSTGDLSQPYRNNGDSSPTESIDSIPLRVRNDSII